MFDCLNFQFFIIDFFDFSRKILEVEKTKIEKTKAKKSNSMKNNLNVEKIKNTKKSISQKSFSKSLRVFFIYSYKIRIDEKKLKIEKIKSISQKSEFFVLVEIHFYVLLFFLFTVSVVPKNLIVCLSPIQELFYVPWVVLKMPKEENEIRLNKITN